VAARTHRAYASLADYLRVSGEKQCHLSRRIRIPQATISRIARGLQMPRPELARRLATACNIPESSFTEAYLAAHKSDRRLSA
jgi:transcriptional regulator with XRE-family HTH domain